jgi:hypothetical protein
LHAYAISLAVIDVLRYATAKEATMETRKLRMLIGLMAVQAAMRDKGVKLFRQATLFQRGGEIGLAGAFQLAERGLDSEIFCWVEVEPKPCRAPRAGGPASRVP